MDRKEYMREVYSKYWMTARDKIYGFMQYDKNLCSYMVEQIPEGGIILDVAMGDGYPFAKFFSEKGYIVHGLDIAPTLIEKCRRMYPDINCRVGNAENLEYPNDYFDCTYCFHSTWYFPNLNKALDEMIRVTRPGGLVIFDIQNRNNKNINDEFQRQFTEARGINRFKKGIKNIAKMILRRGFVDWHFVVYVFPSQPEDVYQYLEEKQISSFQIMVRQEDESIEARSELGSFEHYDRLLFAIRK